MISRSKLQGRSLGSWAMLLALAVPLGLAGVVVPHTATAQVSVDIVIGTPPPPMRVEVVPAPRVGYIWAPGFWSWDGHRHVWFAGGWEAERADHNFVAARWVDGPGGWHFVPAHWEHHDHWEHREREREAFCPPGQAKKGRC